MSTDPITFAMPDGTTMRGFTTTTTAGPDLERAVIFHDMGNGSFASEVVWRTPEPPPAPAPEAAPAAAEPPVDA